jgi:hypothetical protein
MKFRTISVCASFAIAASSTAASAALITFEASGTATGFSELGGFANTPFTVIATADTETKRQCTGAGNVPIANCFLLINSSLDINVDGIGTFSVLSPTLSIRNAFGAFTFAELLQTAPVTVRTLIAFNTSGAPSPFTSYDLVSNIDPFDTTALVQRTDAVPGLGQLAIPTSLGPIYLTETVIGPSRFQASVRSAVPEPASWALMIIGFGAVGTAMRRENRRVRLAYK